MTGIKYDSAKPKMNLLPPKAILEAAKVLTFGAKLATNISSLKDQGIQSADAH